MRRWENEPDLKELVRERGPDWYEIWLEREGWDALRKRFTSQAERSAAEESYDSLPLSRRLW